MKNVNNAQAIRKAWKKSVNVLVLISFFTLQIAPQPNLLAAGEVVLEPVTGTHIPVKPYVPGTENEEAPVPQAETVPSLEDKPLSAPTEEIPVVENESRDLPEYSFDEATDYLTPDYAAAVIVRSVTAEDLKKLTQLKVEVGIAVIEGKLVLFTSGNKEEIRLLPGAENLLKEASLVAHTHPAAEKSKPSIHDFLEAGDEVEYVVSAEGVYAFNQNGLTNPAPYDFEYLASKIENLTDPESSAKETRDLLNAFIQSVDEYNEDKQESLVFRSGHTTVSIAPSGTLTPNDITSLTPFTGYPFITQVAPGGNPTTVGLAPRGVEINYDTNVGGWAGGGFAFDNFGTPGIETYDLSGFSELVFGLQGSTSEIALEIVDDQDRKVAIELTNILADQEQVWAISTSSITGVDLTKVRLLYFIVEGSGKIGTVVVNRLTPNAVPLIIHPSNTLTAANITPLPELENLGVKSPYVTLVSGGSGGSSAVETSRGLQLNHNIPSGGWTGARWDFDLTNTGPIEKADLSGLSQLVFGIKGTPAQAKLEIIDGAGQSFSMQLGKIRSDMEQVWTVPISMMTTANPAFNPAQVRWINFIVEQGGTPGVLEVNRTPPLTTTIQAPSNLDYEFLILDSGSSGKELRLRNKVTGQINFLMNLASNENVSALDVDPSGGYALMNAPVDASMGSLDSRKTLIYDIPNKQFVKPNDVQTGQPIDTVFGQTQNSFGASSYQFVGGVAIFNASTPQGTSQRGIFINLNGQVPVLSETIPFASGNLPVMDVNRGTAFSPQLVYNGSRILFYAQNTSGRHLGLYNVATGALSVQPLPFLVNSPSGEFVLKAVSPDGRFAIYRDAWDFIYAVDYENINRLIQYFQIPGLDPAFLGSLGTTADFRLNTATFLDNNTIEAFLVNGERFLLYIDANDFRILEGPRVIPTSTTLTPANITVIPPGFQIEDRSPQNPAQVIATSRGFLLNYDTSTPGYSGGVIQYAAPADFSGLTDLVLGFKGNASQVILEVWSLTGTTSAVTAVYLTGISVAEEKVFAIPMSLLSSLGIDVAKITSLRVMVEGPHQEGPSRQGVLEVNFVPETRFARPIFVYRRPIPRADRTTGAAPEPVTTLVLPASDPIIPDTVTLLSAAWHQETILETHAALSNSTYNFYLYEIDDSQNGITRELRLKNESTGEIYSLGAVAATETLHALDVNPDAGFAFVNLKNPALSEGGSFKIYDLAKKAFIQAVDPATGQAGDLLGVVDGGYKFLGEYVFFNYTDTTASFQLKKGIILNLAVDGVRMTRSIVIKKDQPIIFTPQGDKILFTSLDPYYNYYSYWGIYDVATGKLEAVQVGHRAGNDPIVAVSPDGAYAIINHAENNEIYALSIRSVPPGIVFTTVPAPLQSVQFLTNDLFEVTLTNGETLYYTTPLTPVVYPPAPPPLPNTQLQTQVVWEDSFNITPPAPVVPKGWTQAASNPNFASNLDWERCGRLGGVELRDLRTGETQLLSTGGEVPKLIDVTPKGDYVIFGHNQQATIQRIDDPSIKLVLSMADSVYHLGLTSIEWTTLASGNRGVVLKSLTYSYTVNLDSLTVLDHIDLPYLNGYGIPLFKVTSNPNFGYKFTGDSTVTNLEIVDGRMIVNGQVLQEGTPKAYLVASTNAPLVSIYSTPFTNIDVSSDGTYATFNLGGVPYRYDFASQTLSIAANVDVSPDGAYAIINHAENNEIYALSIRGIPPGIVFTTVPAPLQSVRFLTNTIYEATLTNGETRYFSTPVSPLNARKSLDGKNLIITSGNQVTVIDLASGLQTQWTLAASNPNFAYRVITQPINNRPSLLVTNLSTGEILIVDDARNQGAVFENVDVTADARYVTYNVQGRTENFVSPLGSRKIFERAKTNSNYAFFVDIRRIGPGADEETLQLLELSTGEVQNLFTTQTPAGLITRKFDVSPDNFSGGPVVVFETADPRGSEGYPFRLNIRRVHGAGGTSILSRYFQLNPAFEDIAFGADTISIQAKVIYPSGTIMEDHYTVTSVNGSFQISGPVSKVRVAGQGLDIDSDTPLVVQPEHLYNANYEIYIYDSSDGVDQLRLIKTISSLGGDDSGRFIFSDAYTTPTGRQIISVGVISGHYNGTWIIDANTGEKLVLQDSGVSFPEFTYTGGAVTSISYNGNLDTYTLLKQDGTNTQACVDLDTLSEQSCRFSRGDLPASSRPLPRAERPEELLTTVEAPSHSDFSFLIYQVGAEKEIRLQNETTGEVFSVTTITSEKEVTGLDVDPSGRFGLLNLQYIKDGYQTGELLVYDIQNHNLVEVQKMNPTPAEDQTIYGRVAPREGNPSPYLFVDGLALLNMYTYFIYQGQYSHFGYVLNLNTAPVRATRTFTIHLNKEVLFTPRKDKLLFGTTQRGNDSITIYDLAAGQIENRALATYGFGGIKAVSPNGKFAIVGSSVNTVYAVPVLNADIPVRLLLLNCSPGTTCSGPTGLVLTSAEFLSNNAAKGTLANGETRYFWVTSQEFRLLGDGSLTRVFETVQSFYGDYLNVNAVITNIEIIQDTLEGEKVRVSVQLKDNLAAGTVKSQRLVFLKKAGQWVLDRVVDFNALSQVLVRSYFDYTSNNGQWVLEKITRLNAFGFFLSSIRYVAGLGTPYYEIRTRDGRRKRIYDIAIRFFDLLREAEILDSLRR